MILLLIELVGSLMALVLFQEQQVIELGIWTIADTECRVDKKVSYTWNSLFQEFQDKEFLMLL